MTYQAFALVLSLVTVVMYVVLLYIAARRATLRPDVRESVKSHARALEGPVITTLLFVAIVTLVAATAISSAGDYTRFAAFGIATLRGALAALGAWLLAWYWDKRTTWR